MVRFSFTYTTDYFTRIRNLIILLPAFDMIIMCHVSWLQQACNLLWHIVDFYSHANSASFNRIQFNELKATEKTETEVE